MDTPPTPQLVALARRGDEAACRELVEQLYPTVIAIVRNHLPRRDEEEDLSQEIFMKMFSKIDRYTGDRPITHWVSKIAINTCYDRLRRQKVRPVASFAELDLDEAEFLEYALNDQPDTAAASDTRIEIANGLLAKLFECLNAREKIAIQLLDLEEHTVEETCNLTGWGASKVKVTAMRARRKLKVALERLESGDSQTTPTETFRPKKSSAAGNSPTK